MTHDHGDDPSAEDGPGPRAWPGSEDPDEGRRQDDTDVDTAFSAIVARFTEDDSPVGPWSAAEDVSEESAGAKPPTDSITPDSGGTGGWGPSGIDASHPPGSSAEEDEDAFVPPDPPSFSGDLPGRLAWLGVIAGPLALVIAVVMGWQVTTLFLAISLGSFVAGLITLVARLPADRPDDGDDGAVL